MAQSDPNLMEQHDSNTVHEEESPQPTIWTLLSLLTLYSSMVLILFLIYSQQTPLGFLPTSLEIIARILLPGGLAFFTGLTCHIVSPVDPFYVLAQYFCFNLMMASLLVYLLHQGDTETGLGTGTIIFGVIIGLAIVFPAARFFASVVVSLNPTGSEGLGYFGEMYLECLKGPGSCPDHPDSNASPSTDNKTNTQPPPTRSAIPGPSSAAGRGVDIV